MPRTSMTAPLPRLCDSLRHVGTRWAFNRRSILLSTQKIIHSSTSLDSSCETQKSVYEATRTIMEAVTAFDKVVTGVETALTEYVSRTGETGG